MDDENPAYAYGYPALYDKEGTRLIAFPPAAGIEECRVSRFTKEICSYAFYGCESMTSVSLPLALETVGEYAFYGCTSLTEVQYGGTEKQWARLTVAEAGNDPLRGAAMLCAGTDFENLLSLPEGLETIESEAFAYLWEAEAVYIPASVTEIADDAVAGTSPVILTESDSYAEAWAKAHGFDCLIP